MDIFLKDRCDLHLFFQFCVCQILLQVLWLLCHKQKHGDVCPRKESQVQTDPPVPVTKKSNFLPYITDFNTIHGLVECTPWTYYLVEIYHEI